MYFVDVGEDNKWLSYKMSFIYLMVYFGFFLLKPEKRKPSNVLNVFMKF